MGFTENVYWKVTFAIVGIVPQFLCEVIIFAETYFSGLFRNLKLECVDKIMWAV